MGRNRDQLAQDELLLDDAELWCQNLTDMVKDKRLDLGLADAEQTTAVLHELGAVIESKHLQVRDHIEQIDNEPMDRFVQKQRKR